MRHGDVGKRNDYATWITMNETKLLAFLVDTEAPFETLKNLNKKKVKRTI